MMKYIAKRSVFLLVACAVLMGTAPAWAGASPMDRVKEGTDKIISMLSNPAMQDQANHDKAIDELRNVAEEYIDFGLVTKYAVGRPWLDMSNDMRNSLKEAFIKLLERTYLKRIPAYGGQKFHYVKEQISGNKAKVFTEIIDKDKKIVVEFRLRQVNGKWMIYDVVAEGVSLVMNYRSQFSEILQKGSAEDLLRTIQDRIQKIDQGAEEEPAS